MPMLDNFLDLSHDIFHAYPAESQVKNAIIFDFFKCFHDSVPICCPIKG